MPRWVPPLLGGSLAIVTLWLALGIQRLMDYRRSWARRVARELRGWDGRLPDDLDQRAQQ